MTEHKHKVIMFIETPDAIHILHDLRIHASARSSFLIGVDGHAGAGKTCFARWLGNNLEMPVVSLDAYKIIDNGPASWRFGELIRDLGPRLIVEGARLCAAMQAIDRNVDVLIWIDNAEIQATPQPQCSEEYLVEFDPIMTADHCLTW